MANWQDNIPQSGIEIYTASDNSIQLQVKLEQDTVWLTASQMAVLFGRDVRTIRKHINNALHEELAGEVVGAKFASTTQHGAMEGKTQTNEVMFYNLEMVTSIGYRVKSKRGVQFRLKSSIGQIYQTFGGEELYPSIEEKAAMLLYLVTKNHSFSDGNKRIAATLFLWFMDRNGILYTPEGHKRIADNTLVALTLMIAESRTEEKDIMVKVVVNLINKKNG